MILIDLIDERHPENRPEERKGRENLAVVRPETSQGNTSAAGSLFDLEVRRQLDLLRAAHAERTSRFIPWGG